MLLAETIAKLNQRDQLPSRRTRESLPSNVRYGSTKGARMMATFAFPMLSPSTFLWIDESVRATKCWACGLVIPKKTERLCVHVVAAHALKAKNGGYRNAERSYYHLTCVDESLAVGSQPRDRRACYDCGINPPEGGWIECGRVYVSTLHEPAFLCPSCAQATWRYQCSHCRVQYPKRMVELRFVNVNVMLQSKDVIAADPKDGKPYVCTVCIGRYGNWGTLMTVAAHEAEQERIQRELQKFEDYRAALDRGEQPEHPWGGEPSDDELTALF